MSTVVTAWLIDIADSTWAKRFRDELADWLRVAILLESDLEGEVDVIYDVCSADRLQAAKKQMRHLAMQWACFKRNPLTWPCQPTSDDDAAEPAVKRLMQ